jgi:hypothetical protein
LIAIYKLPATVNTNIILLAFFMPIIIPLLQKYATIALRAKGRLYESKLPRKN